MDSIHGDILQLRNGMNYQMTCIRIKESTNEIVNRIRSLNFGISKFVIVVLTGILNAVVIL